MQCLGSLWLGCSVRPEVWHLSRLCTVLQIYVEVVKCMAWLHLAHTPLGTPLQCVPSPAFAACLQGCRIDWPLLGYLSCRLSLGT